MAKTYIFKKRGWAWLVDSASQRVIKTLKKGREIQPASPATLRERARTVAEDRRIAKRIREEAYAR